MSKNKLLYIFMGVALIAIFGLGFAMATIMLKKPAKPVAIPEAAVKEEVPVSAVEEEMPALPPVAAVEPAAVPSATEAAVTPPVPAEPTPTVAVESAFKPEFQKGMIYVAWTPDGYSNSNSVKSIEQMKSLGVEWAGLVATWYQDRYNSAQISALPDKTPTDQSLVTAIRQLHDLKIKVMLKPHLDLLKGEGKWRGDILMDSPEAWQEWFKNYTAFIMHYVNIAAQEKVEILCIGTELTQATLGQPNYWRELIAEIRKTYKGSLTYAANWHEEFDQIAFWDALDYAGIDPYFPLVCSMNPKVEELKSAWEYWIKNVEEWQARIKKPIILAEIGYKSSGDATDEPWQHVGMGKLDLGLQVNCYQAILEVFWDKPWFYGAYWWYWGTNPRMGGQLNKGFTPQNKPAQDVVKEWYINKPVSEKTY
ncbi:MAG: hypothetical protein PHG40_01090 [Candidatus Omnitrophica bacterium]|nr:hypothetical protein [Candidatus Omnitrophota bacterium]